MIPKAIRREHVEAAVAQIEAGEVPPARESRKFLLRFRGRTYPPKLVVSLASRFATGKELASQDFSGGQETNAFLTKLGFTTEPIGQRVPCPRAESRIQATGDWIAVVLLETRKSYRAVESADNLPGRLDILERACELVTQRTHGDGVVLFPGGWFSSGREPAECLYGRVEAEVSRILAQWPGKLVACVGLDGSMGTRPQVSRDQIAIAISRSGTEAMGRKFHPTDEERVCASIAEDHLAPEHGKPRTFPLDGRTYFLCVCYDVFGLRQRQLRNPDADVVLGLVHGFWPRDSDWPSGAAYFARHGFAGAAKEWRHPVFGAAVFFDRRIPARWPSGVIWNQGRKSTQNWRYEDNPLKPWDVCGFDTTEGRAVVRLYAL
ncbi:MAG: hypothetical protein FJ291_09785 [Planctomycetes bacterium]|nr:hypothetical protein [Planctomycetota bacterium]